MHGIVRHIKIERLAFGNRLLDGIESLKRKGFRQENILSVIFLQTFNRKTGSRAKVLCTQITAWSSVGTTGNVHVKSHIQRILAGSGARPEMRLSAMDSIVSVVAKQLRQSRCRCRVSRIVFRTDRIRLNAVETPVGHLQGLAFRIRRTSIFQCPVGNTVSGCIHTRHQAAPCR